MTTFTHLDQLRALAEADGSIEILTQLTSNLDTSQDIYLIRYACCGGEGQLSRKVILRRFREHSRFCRKCTPRLRKARQPHSIWHEPSRAPNIQPASWTVPRGSTPQPGDDRHD